jgi:cation diffusion facilitator CzcD-associated flavoprotein CzcO
MFPSRDQLIEHHERHAGEDGTEMLLSTRVERIDPAGDGWLLQTDAGEIQAPQAIVATGYENQPFIPDWSGREDFDGPLLHSSEYRNPEPFVGKKVLVVGAGSLGMEIAHELAERSGSRRERLPTSCSAKVPAACPATRWQSSSSVSLCAPATP